MNKQDIIKSLSMGKCETENVDIDNYSFSDKLTHKVQHDISCYVSGILRDSYSSENKKVLSDKLKDKFILTPLDSSLQGEQGMVFIVEHRGSSVSTTKEPFAILKFSPKIIDIENDNIIHEILVGMVLNNLREYTPNFMYTYGGFICSPPIDRDILNKKENYRDKLRDILKIPETVYELYLELIEDEDDDYEPEEIDDKSVFLEYLPTLIAILKNYIRKCINSPSYRYIRLIRKELTEVLEQTKFFRKNPKNLKKDQDMLDLYLKEIKIFLEKVDYKQLEIYIDFINEDENIFNPELLCSTDDKAVLLLSEFFDDTISFYKFINTRHNEEDLSNIMLQIIISLIIAYKQYGFKHNDLHKANVLIQEKECELTYNLSGKIITLKSRYVARIIDYGLSSITYNGKTIIPNEEDLYLTKIDTKDLTELLRHLELDMFSPFIQGCLSLDTEDPGSSAYEEMEKYILNNFNP